MIILKYFSYNFYKILISIPDFDLYYGKIGNVRSQNARLIQILTDIKHEILTRVLINYE
jgi:hypothetical protein